MATRFLQEILPGFYRCAEQPEIWQPVLDRIREEMQVGSVVIQMLELDQARFRSRWQVRDSLSNARAELHDRLVNNDQNPRFDTNVLRPLMDEQAVIKDEDRFSPHCPRFAAFRERLRMAGLGRSITLDVHYAENTHISMTLHRDYDDPREFSHDQEQLLLQLTPHLRQTMSLSEKLGQFRERAETLSQAVNQFNAGVLTVDGSGQVRWLNDYALRIVGSSRHMKLVGARLRCSNREDHAVLTELIRQAASIDSGAPHPIATLGQKWDNPLQVMAVPVRQCDTVATSHDSMPVFVTLYLSETGTRFVLPERGIARLFGLTPAEARLAVALCEGVALNDYAIHKGISPGTARIQLKSIFAKVGVSRQPELVRLLCTSIASSVV